MNKKENTKQKKNSSQLGTIFKIGGFILLIILFMAFILSSAGSSTENDPEYSIEVYGSASCPHCRNVDAFIEENDVEEKLNIGFLYTTRPQVNQRYLKSCKELTGSVTSCGVPLMNDYKKNEVVSGDQPIIDYLQNELDAIKETENINEEKNLNKDSSITQDVKDNLTLPVVIGGALADSFNPCAWSAMLFLISSLIAIKSSRKKMVKIGSTYILTIFICYLLVGIGLFAFLERMPTGFEKYVYGLLSGVILLAALIEIKDFFWYGKGVSLKIPEKQHNKIHNLMAKSTIPATIAVAALISALEFGCTGGVYLPIIAMLSNRSTFFVAFLYLLLYNFIFVLPLIIILLLVINGKSYKMIEEFRKKNRKLMRLISGLVMLGLAIWIIFQYLV